MTIRPQTTATATVPSSGGRAKKDPFAVGAYLTADGALYSVVGELPQDPTLRLVEDCRTLEVALVSVEALRAQGAQPLAR